MRAELGLGGLGPRPWWVGGATTDSSPPLAGDRLLLRCCPLWSRFLDFCEAQKSIVPACHVQVQREIVASSTLTHAPLSRCQDNEEESFQTPP